MGSVILCIDPGGFCDLFIIFDGSCDLFNDFDGFSDFSHSF